MSKGIIEGLNKVQYKLRRFPKQARLATMAAQYEAAQIIMLDARRRAPNMDGYLEASGYATRPDGSGTATVVEMGFGGAASPYAVEQHENTSYNHPAQRNPGGKAGEAFYFSRAIESTKRAAHDAMADFMRFFFATGKIPLASQQVPTTPTEEKGSSKT